MNRGLNTSAAVLCLFLALLSAGGTAQDTAPPNPAQTSAADPAAQAKIQQFMEGDSVFIENAGQWPDFIRFALDSRGVNVGITDHGPRFQLFRKTGTVASEQPLRKAGTVPSERPRKAGTVASERPLGSETGLSPISEMHEFALVFDGAAAVTPAGRGQSDRKFNYLVGDASKHREGVGSFDAVWHEDLYPGVSLEMTGSRSGVKYNFHVAPGADWRVIRLRYEDIASLTVKEDGALEINIAEGWLPLSDGTPYIYQEVNGEKHNVTGRFTLVDSYTYGFEVTGLYDPTLPLVIDPEVEWSTYLGGTGTDSGKGIALDGNNDCYVVGTTSSNGWISGGWDTTLDATDGFVMKLSNDGIPVWSSYIGGTGTDYGNGIALDSNNACYVVGNTNSSGWVSGGWKTTYAGGTDGYVVKLNSSGGYEWSSYLGGISYDYGNGIALDTNGACFLVGTTKSSGWVVNGDSYGTLDYSWGYVVKLNTMGEHIWSKYTSGGTGNDYAYAVAINSGGDCYVAGSHVWFNYHDSNISRYGMIWIIGSDGTALGSVSGLAAHAYGIAVDNNDIFYAVLSSGEVYKSGDTGWYKSITEATYGKGIAVDSQGNCYITGNTTTSGWVNGGWDTSYNGGYDGFVLKLNSAGDQVWSSYLVP